MNPKKGLANANDDDFEAIATGTTPENEPEPISAAELERTYQAKIEGIRGTAIKFQKQNERLAVELQALRQKYEEETMVLTQERDVLRNQFTVADKEAQKNREQLTKLERREEIGNKIAKEFPALRDLFAEKLLVGIESMEDEALSEYLTRYNAKLTGIADNTLTKAVQGAVPTSASTAERQVAGMTLKDAMANLERVTAQKGYGTPEYRVAFDTYQELVMRSAASE